MALPFAAPPRAAADTVRGLVLACHPGPTVVVTVLSLTLALGAGAPWPVAALVTLAVLRADLPMRAVAIRHQEQRGGQAHRLSPCTAVMLAHDATSNG